MLSSLVSLYIISTLNNNQSFINNKPENELIRLASNNFSEIIKQKNLPVKNPLLIAPVINAKSSISIDLDTGEILYEKNAHKQLPVASITKLMTILIILEENDLSEKVIISNNAAGTEGSTMFLRAGEEISIENLLYGALINSANDAAVALAEFNAENVKKFVEKMNRKARELNLTDTHFSNPIGLDESNNYSSAYDISILAKYLYKNEFIKTSAKIKKMDVKSISENFSHKLESTNDLLNSYLKINGLKTGKTDSAGLCLVAIAENDQGKEIITIVLDSPARFEESKILIDWTFRAYQWATGNNIAKT